MPACRGKSNAGERRRGEWTEEEDRILEELQQRPEMQNHWTAISRMIPARSEAAVKSHWNGVLKHRIARPPAKSVATGALPSHVAEYHHPSSVSSLTLCFLLEAPTLLKSDVSLHAASFVYDVLSPTTFITA